MANFKISEHITGMNEGGYANDKSDRGGETYAGIARNFWQSWKGWKQIDMIKSVYGKSASVINKYAKADLQLHRDISEFYKANFWDVNKLDLFEDQQIADSVYDFGVNSGTVRAAKTLQDVLGVQHDGVIGKMTIGVLNSANFKSVHIAYNCKREVFYQKLATNPSQAKFLRSWMSRLNLYV